MNLIYFINKQINSQGDKLGLYNSNNIPMTYTFITRKRDIFVKKDDAFLIFFKRHAGPWQEYVNKCGYSLNEDTIIFIERTIPEFSS